MEYLKKAGGALSKGFKDLIDPTKNKKTPATFGSAPSMPSGTDVFGSNPIVKEEDIIKPVNVENPYEQQLKAALGQNMGPDFTQAQATGQGQADFTKALQGLYGTGASGLTGLISTLQQQQAGNFGPGGSLAQKVLEQGLGQNIAGVRSQLASQRGLNPALAARYAAQQTAQLGGQTAQQAGILGLQQQLESQKLLGSLTGTAAQLGGTQASQLMQAQRQQDIAQATASSDANLKRLGILAQSDTGIRDLQAKTGMSANEIRMKIQAANQAAAMGDRQMAAGLLGGLMGGAASIGAAAVGKYDGGRIDGKAPLPGDHPANDVVPAKLSPGEIVIPRTSASSKKAAKSFIDSLDDFDEEPSYGKVLKARQKKNYADGGVVEPDLDQEILQKYKSQQLGKGFDTPIPGVEPMKKSLDEMLTGRVVEPMARAGYPTLGAAMATVPSTLAEALVPSTAGDLAGTLIPFPKGKMNKAKEVLKENASESLLQKMGKKIKEASVESMPKSSLEKGGWYDEIGGGSGFISKLDDFVKANSDDPRIESMVKGYRDHIKASEASQGDSRQNQLSMADRKIDALVDYIDRNLDRIKMPSASLEDVKKKITIEVPQKTNSERYSNAQNIFKELPAADRENVFVYRIEDENGKGPWQSKKGLKAESWYDQPDTKINYFMEPNDSNIHKIGPYLEWAEDEGSQQFLYGFKNLDQLNKYFSPTELEKLQEQGFKIVKVKADKTYEGKSQLIFMPYLED
jgi:hypothetical protein